MGHAAQPRLRHLGGTYDGAMMAAVQLEEDAISDMAADYYIENELGREITKEEAREILEKSEEDGLVHHSSNHLGKRIFICNCCGCCCKALGHITKYGNPHAIARSNYYAVID